MARRWVRAVEAVGLRTAARPAGAAGTVLRAVTRASDGSALWIAAGTVLAVAGGPRGRRAALRAAVSLAVTSAVVNGPAKVLVRRRRPGRWATLGLRRAGREPSTSSFPSGHTASAFAFATAAGLEAPAAAPALLGTAALVGWSRLHGGQHFPSDVAAGAALGTAVGAATWWTWDRVTAALAPEGDGGGADGAGPQANLVPPASS